MATDFYEIWDRYNKAKTYMDKKGMVYRTEKNWLMYSGKQWEAVEDSKGMEDLPMLNFIKPTVKYKAASIAAATITALFSDLNSANNDAQTIEAPVVDPMTGEPQVDPMTGMPVMQTQVVDSVVGRLNDLFSVSWEKGKMKKNSKKGLTYAAVEGDCYFFWGEGGDTRLEPQIVHKTSMRLGDENVTDIQRQPWLIIEERLAVADVRERARQNGISKEDIDEIKPDKELQDSLVNKSEVDDKVTSLLYMEKDQKTGFISVAKCTQTVMYEKLHPVRQMQGGQYIDVGLKMYPIVPMIWEEMPNDARGMSEVEQWIPNQLEVNKTLARRAISIKMTAYPRLAYDDASLANPEDLDKVGAAIKLNGGNAQAIGNMIAYLSPQAMSADAKELTDELINVTRTLAGASDAQLGNIDLSRVSGTAAQTVRDQQQLPLNEQQEMYQDFIENVALLWFELWRVYYPEGVEMDGVEVTAEEIADVQPNVRVDIAEDTALSKMATQQELTNLFNNGKISFKEFAVAYPEHSSLPKDLLMNIVNEREQMMAQGQMPMTEDGIPLDPNATGGGVNTGGVSGGSYQSLQSQLAQ